MGDVEEGKPLLAKEKEETGAATPGRSSSTKRKAGASRYLTRKATSKLGQLKDSPRGEKGEPLDDEEEDRVMEYETYHLGTWTTFFYLSGTVWTNRLLWVMLFRLTLVSLVIALVVFFGSHDPGAIDASKFAVVSGLLKVFVGFLLGFFLTSSVSRWGNAVGGFLSLCNAIKNEVMMLHALGAPEDRINQVKRYGMLSAEFLTIEMRVRTDKAAAREEVHEIIDDLADQEILRQDEAAVLKKVQDHSALMWVWVVSLISRMAQDGQVPPMPSPTYGRLLMLANSAEEGIRQVIIASKVQLPFVYVHTLALLVHTNNLLCAIGFGCTLGSSLSTVLARFGVHLYGHVDQPPAGSLSKDLQTLSMAFCTSFVVPLMYQAFLQIGLLLAQPFDETSEAISAVPAKKIIGELQQELADQERMANSTIGWEKPCYQVKK